MFSISNKNKILVITGTTASGKTGLAVKLAHKFNGEIISADCRQVYKYMDIGTGKDLGEYKLKFPAGKEVNIPYHLIDVVHPNTEYNLVKWKIKAELAVKEILNKERVPIIAGGTGLYTQALVDNYDLSVVGQDKKLRERLDKKNIKQLVDELKKINSKFAENLHVSDKKNKRRLIRYLEVLRGAAGFSQKASGDKNDYLIIGLTYPRDILKKRIYERLIERLEKEDMIREVEKLHKKYGVSWKRLKNFGLEYKFISLYLKKELSYDEMVEKLNIAIGQFAKRQMTWLRRWEKQGTEINWVKSEKEAERLVENFLK
ncbi:tRNA (adenosine(37)-N6)-dimethylallyltransferase MiaA [Candidatus Falkowbacteria bacterium]|nr:MAG: tRNA (adenosine(37)-N6)-dimethylallyltransferase MiaA [Candidatus Falkowbacteria bacterium]